MSTEEDHAPAADSEGPEQQAMVMEEDEYRCTCGHHHDDDSDEDTSSYYRYGRGFDGFYAFAVHMDSFEDSDSFGDMDDDSMVLGGGAFRIGLLTLHVALNSQSDWDASLLNELRNHYDSPFPGPLHVELCCYSVDFGYPTSEKSKCLMDTLASLRPTSFTLRSYTGFPISLLKGFLQGCKSTLELLKVEACVVFIDDIGGDDHDETLPQTTTHNPLLSIEVYSPPAEHELETDDRDFFEYSVGMTAFLRLPMFSDGSAQNIELHDLYFYFNEYDDDEDENEKVVANEFLDCLASLRANDIFLSNVFCASLHGRCIPGRYIDAMHSLAGRTQYFILDCSGFCGTNQSLFDRKLLAAMANALKDNPILEEVTAHVRSYPEECLLPSILNTFESSMENNFVLESLRLYSAGEESHSPLTLKTRFNLFLNKGGQRRFKASPTTEDSLPHLPWIKAIMNCNNDDDLLWTRYSIENGNQENELRLSGINYFLRDNPGVLLAVRPSLTTTAATRVQEENTTEVATRPAASSAAALG